jgi:hypothetical protein
MGSPIDQYLKALLRRHSSMELQDAEELFVMRRRAYSFAPEADHIHAITRGMGWSAAECAAFVLLMERRGALKGG